MLYGSKGRVAESHVIAAHHAALAELTDYQLERAVAWEMKYGEAWPTAADILARGKKYQPTADAEQAKQLANQRHRRLLLGYLDA